MQYAVIRYVIDDSTSVSSIIISTQSVAASVRMFLRGVVVLVVVVVAQGV